MAKYASKYATSLAALKIQLGLLGRADFLTTWEDWPGDLIYPDEQLCVFVDSCVWANCPRHTHRQLPDTITVQADANVKRNENIDNYVEGFGWRVLRYFDCQVNDDPKLIATQIIAQLSANRQLTAEIGVIKFTEPLKKAKLIKIDAGTRIGIDAWLRYLETLSMTRTLTSRASITAALREEGWTTEVAHAAWNIAKYHLLISKPNVKSRAYHRVNAELVRICCVEAGIQRTEFNPKSRQSLFAQKKQREKEERDKKIEAKENQDAK